MFKRFLSFCFRPFLFCLETLVLKERSPYKLALSVSVGLYIAFSPFLFMHTIMVLASVWLFSLNLPAVFLGAVVSNPWTVVPCSFAGYWVGELFLKKICCVDPMSLDPAWMTWINESMRQVIGMEGISFYSFFIGGNLLALFVSIIMFPVLKGIFSLLCRQKYRGSLKTVLSKNDENSSEKQKSISRLRCSRSNRGRDCSDRR